MEKINLKTEKKVKETISQLLVKSEYHIYESQYGNFNLSPGAEKARIILNSSWLYDRILKQQSEKLTKKCKFQIWTIEQVKNRSWAIYATDGNNRFLYYEFLYFSNLPVRSFSLWYLDGYLFLPQELKCPAT